MQHHFGDKEGVLTAVLQRCNNNYIDYMSKAINPRKTPSKRISQYVAQCWQFYQSEEYLVMLEILLATRSINHTLTSAEVLHSRSEVLLQQWLTLFPDSNANINVMSEVIRHAHIVLTGLVIGHVLEGPILNFSWHLKRLSATIEAQLY